MTDAALTEKAEKIELVALQSAGEAYCIEITSIREIRRWTAVTTLPNSDPATLGVMNLRGLVIPILDLAARLGMPRTEIGDRSVVVVLASGDRIIGVLVDVVSEIISINEDAVQPNPTRGPEEGPDQITGLVSVGNQMLKVLNVDTLFAEQIEDAA